MRIVVLGAGIIGATTAWTLANAGCEVTVVDRQLAAAEETSKRNACLVTPGHSLVWNHPRAPLDYLASLFQKDPISSAKIFGNPGFFSWTLRFLAQCRKSASEKNSLLNLRLAARSAHLTRQLISQHNLGISLGSPGLLYWHDSAPALEAERRHCDYLNRNGISARILNAAELFELEPALVNSKKPLVGALYVEDDFSADCREFALGLLEKGVREGKIGLLTGNNVVKIHQRSHRVVAVETTRETIEADHYVFSLGPETGALVKPLGVHLPIAPAKGYSLTVPTKNRENPLRYGGVDLGRYVALAPLNHQLRITCYARFEGFNRTWRSDNFRRHRQTVEELLPGAIDWEGDQHEWAGLRPMTPDGIPRHRKSQTV